LSTLDASNLRNKGDIHDLTHRCTPDHNTRLRSDVFNVEAGAPQPVEHISIDRGETQ